MYAILGHADSHLIACSKRHVSVRGLPVAWQVVALLYYMISYFPGGTNGVKFILKMAVGAAAQCFAGMQRAVFR